MRVRLPGFDRVELAKLFTAAIEKKQQKAEPLPPVHRQFKFSDGFETSNNGAQQWLVRREVSENVSAPSRGAAIRPQRTTAGERTTRTMFADGFERSRVAPVDLGQHRSTVSRFNQAPNETQAHAQDNGFHASVNDL